MFSSIWCPVVSSTPFSVHRIPDADPLRACVTQTHDPRSTQGFTDKASQHLLMIKCCYYVY